MTKNVIQVRLAIQQVDFQCLFDLSWGSGQKISALVPFPLSLETQYRTWYNTYISFYSSLPLLTEEREDGDSTLRGRVDKQGNLTERPLDWQAELVQTEADLFYQFHQWLRHQNLFDIRAQIATLARGLEKEGGSVDIFLSAEPSFLARFPWEHWELGAEFGSQVPLRIARCPSQLKAPVQVAKAEHKQGKKFRVLAIMGDERGLNFEGDREALKSVAPLAEIHFVGWQPQDKGTTLKQDVCNAIADKDGWDVLFFAGHSNEKSVTGGEFVLGPNQVLSLQQLIPYLQTAQKHGLQLAIFNSCSGMGIAGRLLELGFSQVAVMREPIHNQVAQAFLRTFLLHLCQEKDAQDSLQAACQDLKLSQGITYPSAYCLPSLYRHPSTDPFQFKVVRWRDHVKRLKPSRWEAIALSFVLLLSLFPPIQNNLLSLRLWAQAFYRDTTGQVPTEAERPPITIVSVDDESLNEAGVTQRYPIDRVFLAEVIKKLQEHQSTIIGVDYLLDNPNNPPSGVKLQQAIHKAVESNKTWLIFSARKINEVGIEKVNNTFGQPTWSLSGDASAILGYLPLPISLESCRQLCPLGYLIALLKTTQATHSELLEGQPNLENTNDLSYWLLKQLKQESLDSELQRLKNLHQGSISTVGKWVSQEWFSPIIDFSIPKNLIYNRKSARSLLNAGSDLNLSNEVVLLGAGSYEEAEDAFKQPLAQDYWYESGVLKTVSVNERRYLSGVEIHGFIVHHFLSQHFVVPIPDFLTILVSALYLKLSQQSYLGRPASKNRRKSMLLWIPGVLGSGIASLQLFLSVAIIFPWLSTSLTIAIYKAPNLWGTSNEHRA